MPSRIEIVDLHRYGGAYVAVRLVDGSEYHGRLRTELLSPRSVSVFIAGPDGGVTLYIDQIVDLWMIEPTG